VDTSHCIPERIFEILGKIATCRHARACELHVILAERVGNDEVRPLISKIERPVRQIIGVRVGIILESPFLDDKPARILIGLIQ